jgi:hypothetical protein
MKQLILLFILLITGTIKAQNDCEYSTNVKDSIGTYKSTKEYMIFEKNFAGKKNYIFFSLVLTDGTPSLNVQLIQKSKDFIKVNCFDKDSKLFFQLNNGKIITLTYNDKDKCASLLRDNDNFDNRLLLGNFAISKETIEDLKTSPVNLMRVKYQTDVENFIFRKEFTAEMNNQIYKPESYFINFLKCIN